MTYSEKLRSPKWQKKRLQILERDKWACLCCGNTEKNLQVHHVVYGRRDPWEYPDELYQTLCDDCHRVRQELTDKSVDDLRIALKDIPTERLMKVAQNLMAAAMNELGAA